MDIDLSQQMRKTLFSLFLLFFSFTQILLAQQDSTRAEIQIATAVNQTKVPLNRTLQLKVTIFWVGDPDRFNLNDFDNPALTNLEIVGTASGSRTEIDTVFKEFVYTLKPKELGMAYVEGVVLKAHDQVLDKDVNLVTQRISIEAIDPIPEPGEQNYNWLIIAAALILVSLLSGIFVWIRRRKRSQQAIVVAPVVVIEKKYLEDLRSQIDLERPDLRDDYSKLSRLLRRYLTEKFSLRALEATTDEISAVLETTPMEGNQITNVREILGRADEVRFSGIEGSKEELSRFYTFIESILASFLRQSEEEQKAEEIKK